MQAQRTLQLTASGVHVSNCRHALLAGANLATTVLAAVLLTNVVRGDPPDSRIYLDNGQVWVAADLARGGAITWLSPSGSDRNVVNNYDRGRQIQMSHYSGPVPFRVGDQAPPPHWEHLGWNPIQAGDDFGHGPRILAHTNDGQEIYVRCAPLQWPLNNVPSECEFETWIRLEGPAVVARYRFTNRRSDRMQYPARLQELPAIYVNAPYSHLMTYRGPRPFTGEPLEEVVKPAGEPGPWTSFLATEEWAALVDEEGWGLGVWSPGCVRYSGGFAGTPGVGGEFDLFTGYLAPNSLEVIDHDIVYEYECRLVLGTAEEMRAYVAEHRGPKSPPQWTFDSGRQGWSYVNATDAGWPIQNELNVSLADNDPYLLGPLACWEASAAPRLEIEAAYDGAADAGTDGLAAVYWARHDAQQFAEERHVTFPVRHDGAFHTYTVDLSAVAGYSGMLVQLRFDPGPGGQRGAHCRIRSIRLLPAQE